MFTNYLRYHAGCLRSESVAPGPGELIVALAKAIRIECLAVGPQESAHMPLQEGTILYASGGLTDVKGDIDKHLAGSVGLSELRLGASGLLGLEPAMRDTITLSANDEQLIDDWLDEYAIFYFIVLNQDDSTVAGIGPLGLFNGIRRAWNGETSDQGGMQ